MTTEQIVYEETTTELFSYDPDDGDPNRKAHVVRPTENMHIWKIGMEGQDIVDLARITQREVIALCGHKFTPKFNPDRYDACEPCMATAAKILAGE